MHFWWDLSFLAEDLAFPGREYHNHAGIFNIPCVIINIPMGLCDFPEGIFHSPTGIIHIPDSLIHLPARIANFQDESSLI
jgi:hypothetical protein